MEHQNTDTMQLYTHKYHEMHKYTDTTHTRKYYKHKYRQHTHTQEYHKIDKYSDVTYTNTINTQIQTPYTRTQIPIRRHYTPHIYPYTHPCVPAFPHPRVLALGLIHGRVGIPRWAGQGTPDGAGHPPPALGRESPLQHRAPPFPLTNPSLVTQASGPAPFHPALSQGPWRGVPAPHKLRPTPASTPPCPGSHLPPFLVAPAP